MVYNPSELARARGARSNPAGRFESIAREIQGDGWEIPEQAPKIATEVRLERIQKVITKVDSPDLNFDRSINPYRGCEHGCIYCFARPTHSWLGMSAGLDFETRLIARPNAAERLAQELSSPEYRVRPIAIGTNTDPYQPLEKTQKIMRSCLKVLSDFNHPVMITTKGTLVERDLDILEPMATKGLVQVGVSITTLDPGLSRRLEPRVPSPARRLQAVANLSDAGIPVRLMVAPVIPGLTDHELEAIVGAGAAAGATAANWIILRLPFEVAVLFREWLEENAPLKANKVMARVRETHGGRDYDATFGKRRSGGGTYAQLIAHRFKLGCRKANLIDDLEPLRNDLFKVPQRSGDQLCLF